jgi:hypothetical protein
MNSTPILDDTAASWTPRLDERQCLIGPLPRTLDLRAYKFPATKVFIHDYEEHAAAESAGRPVQPNCFIAGDDTVEVLYLPADEVGLWYVVIENLPNLRELHVCVREERRARWFNLKWLTCQNLPRLQRLTAQGALVWIDLLNMNALQRVDVTKCRRLDHFRIVNAPTLRRVNVRGCVKLRKIEGLNEGEQQRLGVDAQIQRMQAKSRRDRKLYRNMTYTDVDLVLGAINDGVKAACRNGDYSFDPQNVLGRCDGKEDDSAFEPFRFDLLRPLEAVYTGGTGEIYEYESLNIHFDWNNGKEWCSHSIGNSSQEDCLKYALHWESMTPPMIPERPKPTERQLLEFFATAVDTVPYDFRYVRTVYVDAKAALSSEWRAEYERRLMPFNFSLVAKRSANVDLWVVYDIDDESQWRVCCGRNVLIDERYLERIATELESLWALRVRASSGSSHDLSVGPNTPA